MPRILRYPVDRNTDSRRTFSAMVRLMTHWTNEAGRLSITAGLSAFMNMVRLREVMLLLL